MLGSYLLEIKRRKAEIQVYLSGVIHRVKRKSRFVIFGPGRSGSTLLVKLINSNSEVFCDMEELRLPRLFPLKYIDYRSKSDVSSKPVYGFKMQHNHLALQGLKNEEAVIKYFRENDWKFIFLWRKNILRQALSLEIARERGVWFVSDPNKGLDTVTISPHKLLSLMTQINNSHDIYRSLLQTSKYLELVYEDDLFDIVRQKVAMTKIAVFLDVYDEFEISPDIRKTVGRNLSASVKNWSEIDAYLKKSQFSELLNETHAV